MKKIVKTAVIIASSVAASAILLLLVSSILYSPEYVYRCVTHGVSTVMDYSYFPERIIEKSSKPYKYEYDIDNSIGRMKIQYQSKGIDQENPLDEMLEKCGTTSLIVIRNDRVVHEKYFNGYDKDSTQTSFSTVKSIDSLLIGMAIEDGYIKNEMQSIADFIPEFKGTEFEKITIENLLMMRSNIYYEEGMAYFTDDAKTYYMPDLRDLALNHMKIDPDYQGQFHYNNYHPLLLGIILERSTGQRVAEYFQKKIWDKVGAENDCSWSLDSEKKQFEKMESGLNFKSIDYIKIGSMMLHRGNWNGQQVIGNEWIDKSVYSSKPLSPGDSDSEYLNSKNVGYRYMWYSTINDKGGYDFHAAGNYGQYIYVSPENNVVILRTGNSYGNVDWWPGVLKQIAVSTGTVE